MAQKKTNKTSVVSNSLSIWEVVIGVAGCSMIFIAPFFPDEKLVRLKMQVLEIGLFLLATLLGWRIFLASSIPFSWFSLPRNEDEKKQISAPAMLSLVVLFWVILQVFLGLFFSEKALAAAEIRRVAIGAASFILFLWAGFTLDWIRRLLTSWALSASLLAVYGWLQVTGGIGIIQVPQMERIAATYGNPIFFAAFLLPSIFISLAAHRLQKTNWIRFLILAGTVIQCIALYHTKTRASWVGFIAAFAIAFFFKIKKMKFSPVFVLLGTIVVGLFAYQTRHVWEREQGHALIWRDTIRMWTDKPLVGVGLGAFHTSFPAYAQDDLKSKWPKGQFIVNYTHNEFLQVLAEGGLIGFVGFILVLFFIFRSLVLFLRTPSDDVVKTPLSFMTMAMISILVQNFFSVDMRFGVSFISFFMIAGLATSCLGYHEIRWKPIHMRSGSVPARWVGSAVWTVLLFAFILPQILIPYRAQKAVSQTAGFFDERLLDPAKSIQDLETLASQYPKEPAVLDKLAYVYAKEMKTADNKINLSMAQAAISAYERLIEVDPKRLSAFNNLANINYTMGKSEDAIRLWKQCIEIDPAFLDAQLNLGKILYVKGELKESAQYFQKVLELNPGNSEAIVYLKRMVE